MEPLRYPKLTGATDHEQLEEIKSFLLQHVQQLEMAFDELIPANQNSEEQNKKLIERIVPLLIDSDELITAIYAAVKKKLDREYKANISNATTDN